MLKNHSFPAFDFLYNMDSVKIKPASLLVTLGKALNWQSLSLGGYTLYRYQTGSSLTGRPKR